MDLKQTYLYALAAAVFTFNAHAVTVLIDFNQSSPSSHGGTWNNTPGTGQVSLPLVDISGNATGITLADTLANQFTDVNTWTGGTSDWVHDTAGDDAYGFSTATATVTLAGLTASQYRLELVSSWANPVISTAITINSFAADATSGGGPVVNPWNSTVGSQTNYLIWNSIAPSGNAITIDLVNNDAFGGINALRLTEADVAVPEPSVYGPLFGVLAVLMTIKRRKRV